MTSTSATDYAMFSRYHQSLSANIRSFFQAFVQLHQGRTMIFTSDKTSAPCHYRIGDHFLHIEPIFDHGVNIALAFDSVAFGFAMEDHAVHPDRLALFAIFNISRRTHRNTHGKPR